MYIYVNTHITHVYIYIQKKGNNFVYTVHAKNGGTIWSKKKKKLKSVWSVL